VSATGTVGVREKSPIRVCTARQETCQPPLDTYGGVVSLDVAGLASQGPITASRQAP
jgi:hypothetical protein